MERQKSKLLSGLGKIYNRLKEIYKNSIAKVSGLGKKEEKDTSPGTDVNCGVSEPRATLYHHDYENLFDNLWGLELKIGTVVEERLIAYLSNMRVKLKPKIWILENSITHSKSVVVDSKSLRRVKEYNYQKIPAVVKCPGNSTLGSKSVSVHAPQDRTDLFRPYRDYSSSLVYTLELNSDFNYEVVKVERLDSMIII